MPPLNRIYNKGEKPADVFSNYHGSNKFNRYFYARVGEIEEIDYDRYRMRIIWRDGSGSPEWMPISFAYAGPGGCLGMMPEEHAIGVFTFYNEGHGKGSPLAVTFLTTSLANALEFNTVKIEPDQISQEDENIIRYRLRTLGENDMIMSSPLGAQIFLNNNTEIIDGMQDNILLRHSDQSIIQTSLNNFVFADGVSVSAGQIFRNNMNLFDADGNRLENTNGRETTLDDGRDAIYIVPFGSRIEYDTNFYCEYRVDVDETCDGILDENDINGYTSASTRDPIVTMAMGNYVGAVDDTNYGIVLRPVLFSAKNDIVGNFSLRQCSQRKGFDEVTRLGLAYALHFLKSGAFMGVDKEGHYHMYLPASSNHPLGGGRSMSVLADGNRKEIWGKSSDTGNSWDFVAKGGIKWDIGVHNPVGLSRSIDIRTDKGVYYEYGDVDDEGFAKQEKVFGPSSEFVGGDYTQEVAGAHTVTIDGLKTEVIRGAATEKYTENKSVEVAKIYNEAVMEEKQCQFGKRKTTINGDDELTINKGDLVQTIQGFGNKKTSLQGAGGIEENITAGNKKISITTGNYELDVSAGQIDISTGVGTVTIKGTSIEIEGTASVSVKGIKVDIGNGPRGGVVTGTPGTPSHFDYVTGSPLKGAITVKAGA